MSMHTHIVGFSPPDENWRKMKVVWDACKSLGIDPPDAVGKFFSWEEPDDQGIMINLDKFAKPWTDNDMREGFEIEIATLPKNITHIRFYNSY